MRKNFDKILLGTLWLLVVLLATTFWMNITFGFNLFSGAHWAYLSELQAKKATIQPRFYMSLIGGILIALIGLYLLLRPKSTHSTPEPAPETPAATPSHESTVFNSRPMSPLGNRPRTTYQQPTNIPTAPISTPIASQPQTQFTQPKPNSNPFAKEIQSILESGGYQIKPCNKISDILSPVVTLGYNHTLYIVTSCVKTDDLETAITTLSTLFLDTLGDTANDITIRGIIINPKDNTNTNSETVTIFTNMAAFRQFVSDNPNTQPEDYDQELFEAMDTYITTVTGYIGKN